MSTEADVKFLRWFVEWGEGIQKDVDTGPWSVVPEIGNTPANDGELQGYWLKGQEKDRALVAQADCDDTDELNLKFCALSRSLVPGMVEAAKEIIREIEKYDPNDDMAPFAEMDPFIIAVAQAYRKAVEAAGVEVPK